MITSSGNRIRLADGSRPIVRMQMSLRVRPPKLRPSSARYRTLQHSRYARLMTIALGVVCTDGVVLGVDLQYTTDDATKTPGRKMFGSSEKFMGKLGLRQLAK